MINGLNYNTVMARLCVHVIVADRAKLVIASHS